MCQHHSHCCCWQKDNHPEGVALRNQKISPPQGLKIINIKQSKNGSSIAPQGNLVLCFYYFILYRCIHISCFTTSYYWSKHERTWKKAAFDYWVLLQNIRIEQSAPSHTLVISHPAGLVSWSAGWRPRPRMWGDRKGEDGEKVDKTMIVWYKTSPNLLSLDD